MIRIAHIDEMPERNEGESRIGFYVAFDDGTRYEGLTNEDGSGGDGLDRIEHLRIGDEYHSMDDFIKDIHGETVEVGHRPLAKPECRYTVNHNGRGEDCNSLDTYVSAIADARNEKGGLSIFDNENQEIVFFKYEGKPVYIDNI